MRSSLIDQSLRLFELMLQKITYIQITFISQKKKQNIKAFREINEALGRLLSEKRACHAHIKI